MDDEEWERVLSRSTRPTPPAEDQVDTAVAAEFARDLLKCLGALQSRSLLIWFFRAFYDLSSREIATHPSIRLEVGHVDVVMQRTRAAIQQCLQQAGHDASEIPVGVYARIWDASRSWGLGQGEQPR